MRDVGLRVARFAKCDTIAEEIKARGYTYSVSASK
jgi:hypothetical protein